jgi:hypothetical protein
MDKESSGRQRSSERREDDPKPAASARTVLGVLAVAVALLAFARLFDNVETSSVTATTYAGAAQSPAATSTATPTPSPSAVIGTVVTQTKTSASDAVEVALITFAALCILMTIFYNRLTSIAGLGITLGLSPVQKHGGAKVIAEVVAERAARLRPKRSEPLTSIQGVARLGRLPEMAVRTDSYDDALVESSTADLTETTARVTELTLAAADHLVRLRNNPATLAEEAQYFGIRSETDIEELKRGTVTDAVWKVLTDHSLTLVGVPAPAP